MAVRYGLSIGEDLDAWIQKRSDELGIAKNAFVIMCVANARSAEENIKMMNNQELFRMIENMKEMSDQ